MKHGLSPPWTFPCTQRPHRTLPDKIMKIGVGHLFATGNRPGRDEIFHIAGMRYSEESAPEEMERVIDPGRRLTRRLYEQSKISKTILTRKQSWAEAKLEIVSFFAELDVLFVYDRENHKQWFSEHILGDESMGVAVRRPVLVDLLEMTQFFLPDRNLPSNEELIRRFLPKTEWKPSDPRLPLLVRSLGGVLQNIVSCIRSESEACPGGQLIYTMLGRALGAETASAPPSAFRDFEELFRVAGMAHRIQWNKDSLFAKPYGDKGPQIIRDTDFPKDPAIESDARKRENWLIRQWTNLLSEEATQGLESVSSPKRIDPESPPRVARAVVAPGRVDEAFDWLIEKEDFQPRKEQQDYARFFTEAINNGGAYAIEAGTGTGKTLGYLIPACECIRQSQAAAAKAAKDSEKVEAGKIIIATATKNLQDHLLEKEWRRLTQSKSLYQDFKAATLKGKNNFLCITAVADLFGEIYRSRKEPALIENISPDDRIRKRLAWLFLFLVLIRNQGKTEGIPWKSLRRRFPDLDDLHDEARADVACAPSLCRMGAACIYPRHLQKAQAADVVVTNHYKLPRMDSLIEALGHTCLIDEADQFPDNLRNAAAERLSRYEIHRLFLQRIQGSANRRGFAQILQDRFTKQLQKERRTKKANEDKHETLEKTLENALQDVQSILASCEAVEHCSNSIENILENRKSSKNDYNFSEQRWIDCLDPLVIENLQEQLFSLAAHCQKIASCCDNLSQKCEKIKNVKQKHENKRILKYKHYANELAQKADAIKNDYLSDEYVHVCSYNYNYKYNYKKWILEKIPYDISKIVTETCCRPYATTVFTSATLFVDNSLDLFSAELGMPFDGNAQRQIASPFAYEKQVRAFVTTSVPAYNHRASRETKIRWRRHVASTLARLAVAMNGRTLVLFTSTEEMKSIFEQVQPVLEKHGIDPLLQNGTSLAEIDTFLSIEESVLFGVDRFWTGVDFPGRTLSQVIVVRLPNPNLSRPIIRHRLEIMKEAFWENYYGPASRLQFRQGFGRLIRKESDEGLFVALDQRIWSDERMRNLQGAVPVRLHRRSTEPDEMDWFIDEGLAHLGLKAEFKDRNIDLRNIKIPDKPRPAASGKPRPAPGRPGQKR